MTDHLATLIKLALEEDIGSGDITTKATIDPKRQGTAVIRAKQSLVVAGLCVAETVFSTVDTKLLWKASTQDGDRVDAGTPIAHVRGSLASLLTAERTALNFLQRLSGIATLTRTFVDAVKGTNVKILDTRKTTPGWRTLEKGAVRAGGGDNHRLGLFDRYLIKNNHITAAGSLEKAIELVRAAAHNVTRTHFKTGARNAWWPLRESPEEVATATAAGGRADRPPFPESSFEMGSCIEVEARTLEDVKIATQAGVDIIMLDNMTVDQVREAVKMVGAQRAAPLLEVSGNITLENVRSYAETGVDCISIGALTHSAPTADLHMIILTLAGTWTITVRGNGPS